MIIERSMNDGLLHASSQATLRGVADARSRWYISRQLRHSYGTALAGQGVPMRTLQEWMGHKDIQDHPAIRRLLPERRRARRRRGSVRSRYHGGTKLPFHVRN